MIKISLIEDTSFFTPTAQLKELAILEYIENKPDTTQKELGQIASAAPSMINVYINDYEEKGYIIREYISAKLVNYKITPRGINRKNYLSISYLHQLMKLYRLAKENVEGFLQDLRAKGYKKILLYGAGEVAETILSVMRDRKDLGLEIVALVDDDESLYGERLMGYKVVAPGRIGAYNHDGVVVASYTYEKDILDNLERIGYPGDRVLRFFSV